MVTMKNLAFVLAIVGGAAVICPLCLSSASPTALQGATITAQLQDTATARMHISGMTCATCPVTARTALKKLAGVFEATVTLDDSLGVVRYDPQRVTPKQIAAHLTRLTGYKTALLPDSAKPVRKAGGA
jgi:mercuric ion binding protein